jgi:hypothetical protein
LSTQIPQIFFNPAKCDYPAMPSHAPGAPRLPKGNRS